MAELERAYFAPPVHVPLVHRTKTRAKIVGYYAVRYVLDWIVLVVLIAIEVVASVLERTLDAAVRVGDWLTRPRVAAVWVAVLRAALAVLMHVAHAAAYAVAAVVLVMAMSPSFVRMWELSAQLVCDVAFLAC